MKECKPQVIIYPGLWVQSRVHLTATRQTTCNQLGVPWDTRKTLFQIFTVVTFFLIDENVRFRGRKWTILGFLA